MYQRNDFCDPTVHPTSPSAHIEFFAGEEKNNKNSLTLWAEGAVGCTVGSQKSFLWYIDQPWYPI